MSDPAPLSVLQACKDCGDDAVREFLSEPEFDTNDVDEIGLAGLHYAAQAGHWPVVKELLASAASINVNLASHEGNTAWHFACRSEQGNAGGRINVLMRLANSRGINVDVNARNNSGETGFLPPLKPTISPWSMLCSAATSPTTSTLAPSNGSIMKTTHLPQPAAVATRRS